MKQTVEPATVTKSRILEHIVTGIETSDGAGVNLTRVLTQNLQRRLDPFLMLDNFRSDDPDDYIAGFPPHPHRGFETVTFMIAGRMRHRDSTGREGLLENGSVQWMTAGRGIIHSEMPEQEDGLMEGFQLWLNLPAKNKMMPAWYRDIPKEEIPQYVTGKGVSVRVISGTSNGVAGAITREDTEPIFIDIDLPAGSDFSTQIPAKHNAFICVYRGEITIAGQTLGERRMGIFANTPDSDGVTITASVPAKAILISGRPLGEPIMQHGPFVMNTQQELYQAVRDYQEGRLAETA